MKRLRIVVILMNLLLLAGCGANGDSARVYEQPEMKGDLTISVFYQSRFLEMAAAAFMDKHPDVTITINNFVDYVQTVTNAETGGISTVVTNEYSYENYLLYINTMIMSGDADDLFDTRALTTHRYEDMGVFEDLSFYMEHAPEINAENFYMNLFDAMRTRDGKLYELPVAGEAGKIAYFDERLAENANLYLDEGTKTISYREAMEYAKALYRANRDENVYLTIENPAQVVMQYVGDDYERYIDLYNYEVHLDSEAFIGLLYEVQAIYEEFGEMQSLSSGTKFAYNFDMSNIQIVPHAMLYPEEWDQITPQSDVNGAVHYNAQTYAINSNSPNKDLAWEFLRFMLTDEVQTLPLVFQPAISKSGLDAFVERLCTNLLVGSDIELSQDECLDMVQGWLMTVNTHHRRDALLEEKMFSEISRFIAGVQSAEETAKVLQNWCSMYLNQ